ncbi:glucose-dependent insulinotropic receptor [Melanotaenia boesemani]|uniref:glucose-dependent insulinotropic receptor n=1 Tax=Melanotaenia boesemani TaxID=1250792 RepID=UPI001C057ACA|nr:glucose-dependent insulinotropic receptor [Melanotaenia boesemani]
MTSGSIDSNQPMTQSDMRPRVMGLILSIASCLIISINLLVAAALLKLLLKKSSQSWCFVLNLALADILVGVGITGLAVEDFNNNNAVLNQHSHTAAHLLIKPTPPPIIQGKTRCLLRMAFVTSPCTASIMSMFLISLDRYAAIKMPLRYSLLSGKWTAAWSLLAVWVSSITMGFLPVVVQQLQARKAYDGFCAFFSVMHEIGIVVAYCVLFFPVLSLFIYMYLDILKIACSHQKQISQVRHSRSADHHYGHHHPQHQQLRSGNWSHVKALRTVALLIGCFLVLWCPFFVVCIAHILCESCGLKEVLENYLWLLGLSNSLINPLVYAFWQKEVRLQLAAMFFCITSRLAGPGGISERCHPLPQVQTQTCVPAGDAPSPSLLDPVSRYQAHVLSATTSL